MNLWSIE